MPNKELLKEYAQYKIELADLEARMELIKDAVLAEVIEIKGDSDSPVQLSDLPGYSFSIQKRKTWTYPSDILDAEQVLKDKKKEAEATGEATFIEKEQLMFNSPKEK